MEAGEEARENERRRASDGPRKKERKREGAEGSEVAKEERGGERPTCAQACCDLHRV